jgi:hypothetical protein
MQAKELVVWMASEHTNFTYRLSQNRGKIKITFSGPEKKTARIGCWKLHSSEHRRYEHEQRQVRTRQVLNAKELERSGFGAA